MGSIGTNVRRALGAALVAMGVVQAAWAQPAVPYSPPYVKGSLVQVDVYDRFDGTALPVYAKDGRSFIVGAPGHEYAVRIRNCTGGRVLVVTSVDGVNVISGDTASPDQSGYVLEPWGSVEIAGWRKSMERTAAFYFTDLGDSYAARTGRPRNVGVIGVAVFQERRPVAMRRIQERVAEAEWGSAEPVAKDSANAPVPPAAAAAPAPMQAPANAAAGALARSESQQAVKSLGKLGTGHGRSEDSHVTLTQFERASSSPAETVAIQYDRRENLVAMGVLPQPLPPIARRTPDPFPGALRFAPDPR
ncbi:MAG: hypothetical protein U1F10_07675 [Burkholderiales bacterium]